MSELSVKRHIGAGRLWAAYIQLVHQYVFSSLSLSQTISIPFHE